MSENEVSSMEVLEFDLEDESVLIQGTAVVDEVSGTQGDVKVYVRGEDVEYNSPPRKLNEKMLEHGYSYLNWAMNGASGDNRAIFNYTSLANNV